MQSKVISASITIISGYGLSAIVERERGDKLIEEKHKNLAEMSKLLSNGFHIMSSVAVRTDDWCGVQYLLLKEDHSIHKRSRRHD